MAFFRSRSQIGKASGFSSHTSIQEIISSLRAFFSGWPARRALSLAWSLAVITARRHNAASLRSLAALAAV